MFRTRNPNSHIRTTPITKLRTESTRAYMSATRTSAPHRIHRLPLRRLAILVTSMGARHRGQGTSRDMWWCHDIWV
jgi:hypothetical protein